MFPFLYREKGDICTSLCAYSCVCMHHVRTHTHEVMSYDQVCVYVLCDSYVLMIKFQINDVYSMHLFKEVKHLRL